MTDKQHFNPHLWSYPRTAYFSVLVLRPLEQLSVTEIHKITLASLRFTVGSFYGKYFVWKDLVEDDVRIGREGVKDGKYPHRKLYLED